MRRRCHLFHLLHLLRRYKPHKTDAITVDIIKMYANRTRQQAQNSVASVQTNISTVTDPECPSEPEAAFWIHLWTDTCQWKQHWHKHEENAVRQHVQGSNF